MVTSMRPNRLVACYKMNPLETAEVVSLYILTELYGDIFDFLRKYNYDDYKRFSKRRKIRLSSCLGLIFGIKMVNL